MFLKLLSCPHLNGLSKFISLYVKIRTFKLPTFLSHLSFYRVPIRAVIHTHRLVHNCLHKCHSGFKFNAALLCKYPSSLTSALQLFSRSDFLIICASFIRFLFQCLFLVFVNGGVSFLCDFVLVLFRFTLIGDIELFPL